MVVKQVLIILLHDVKLETSEGYSFLLMHSLSFYLSVLNEKQFT